MSRHQSKIVDTNLVAEPSNPTRYLYKKRKTELIGDPKEGYIVVPERRDWRALKL